MADHHMETGNSVFLWFSTSFSNSTYSALVLFCYKDIFIFVLVLSFYLPSAYLNSHILLFLSLSFIFVHHPVYCPPFLFFMHCGLSFSLLMLLQCCTCPLGGSGRHSQGDQWPASPGWHGHSVLQVSTTVFICVCICGFVVLCLCWNLNYICVRYEKWVACDFGKLCNRALFRQLLDIKCSGKTCLVICSLK